MSMLIKDQFAKTQLDLGDAAPMIGRTIAGRYKIERWLGEGGMGTVYLVEHVGIHKQLALKLLRPELAAIPDVRSRFESEAMTAANLDHPNIVNASDYGCTDDGRCYLALEYVNGKELRSVLDEAPRPMPLARALFIARQITSALAHAHELGVVHRDLKPENIMLVRRHGHDDFVKVLDFGLAQISRHLADKGGTLRPANQRDKRSAVGDICGTPAYMAPEQSLGEQTDGRSDLYSLGIILYELLAGTRPFAAGTPLELMQQHIATPPPLIRDRALAANVPDDVEALLRRLLAKNPEQRIQHAEQLLAEIDRLVEVHQLVLPTATPVGTMFTLSSEPAVGQRISLISKAWTPRPPRWLLACGALCICALSIGLVWRSRIAVKPAPQKSATRVVMPSPVVAIHLAPQAAFEAASAQGLAALETLASRYPADLRLKRALLRSYTNQEQHGEAMRIVAQLSTYDPGTGSDAEVIKSITAALHGNAEEQQAAATLLERELGAAGVDLLYDLSGKRVSSRLRSRLDHSLSKPEVLAKASPAMRVAVELRTARRCEAKRALLPRAEQDGDRRVLAQLKSWTETDGCGVFGLQDCWPCLRKHNALRSTIAALESRLSAQKSY